MIEIKFRAWNSYEKKMYEWDEVCRMDSEGSLTLTNLLNNFIKHVKPIQYTGLKDKNGKEIYEEDIVVPRYNHLGPMRVIYRNGAFNISRYLIEECEIIGNIYKNPELLLKR